MYRVYGYSYSNEDFYYPERLAHDLETGVQVGVVAVADNGEIVGHVGVMRPNWAPGRIGATGGGAGPPGSGIAPAYG